MSNKRISKLEKDIEEIAKQLLSLSYRMDGIESSQLVKSETEDVIDRTVSMVMDARKRGSVRSITAPNATHAEKLRLALLSVGVSDVKIIIEKATRNG